MEYISTLVQAVNYFVLIFFLVLNACYLTLVLLSFKEIYSYLIRVKYGGYDRLFNDPLTPPVSLLVPAYNEELNISLSVKNLLHLHYPKYEVIVINDGSRDKTMDRLKETFRLVPERAMFETPLPSQPIRMIYQSLDYPNLRVIDKDNGGKADALNAGINLCQHPYFLSVDADAILEEDALLKIIRPVVEDPKHVVAVGGIVRVANGCSIEKGRVKNPALSRDWLPVFQVVEYLRAFLAGRTGFSAMNANMIISGAFGLFRRDVTLIVGGYKQDTVGEDMELVTAFHAYGRENKMNLQAIFIGDPVCWTEVPATLKILSRQRRRWHRGLLEVLSRHRRMLFNPRYGSVGLFAYPFLFFFEGWGTLVEMGGYVFFILGLFMGVINQEFALAFLGAAILLGMTFSLASLLLEEFSFRRYPRWRDFGRLLLATFIENLGYRQVTAFFRLQGLWDHLRKKKGWGHMERKGLKN